MNTFSIALAAVTALSLVACNQAEHSTVAPESATPGATQPAPSATSGSIDIVITAETIDRNSRGDANSHQCQLNFEASNRSDADVTSLIIEFDALPAAGAVPVASKLNLTMPMLIKAGATQAAWGPVTVDNHRCDALQLSFPPQPDFFCRTRSKAPCAGYRFSASGIALAG